MSFIAVGAAVLQTGYGIYQQQKGASDARKAEYIRSVAQPKMRISGVHKESGLKNLLLAKKQKEMEAYNRMMDNFSELKPASISKDAPNFPLAIIKALIDEEGGGEGYQYGGLAGNSLLGMQSGGYASVGSGLASLFQPSGGLASIARARKIGAAKKDVRRRATKIKKKQSSSGVWGKIGSMAGKALATAAMAALAPATGGASLLFAKSLGSGLGSYAGARFGYGDKVGSGLGGSKWLAGSRRQLGEAESGLQKSFQERGLASGATTFAMGAIEGDLKGSKWKPDLGKTPMGGGMAPAGLPGGGDLSKAYAGSPEGYAEAIPGGPTGIPSELAAAETFEYKPSGLGAGAGSKALGTQPLIGGSDFSKQLSEVYSGSPAGYTGDWSQYGASQGALESVVPETVDPLAGLTSGQNTGWTPDWYDEPVDDWYDEPVGGQSGGYVSGRHGGYSREDMALLDMIYRR